MFEISLLTCFLFQESPNTLNYKEHYYIASTVVNCSKFNNISITETFIKKQTHWFNGNKFMYRMKEYYNYDSTLFLKKLKVALVAASNAVDKPAMKIKQYRTINENQLQRKRLIFKTKLIKFYI